MAGPAGYLRTLCGVLVWLAAGAALAAPPGKTGAPTPVQKHLLILDTLDVSEPSVAAALSALERELRDSGPPPVVIHTRVVSPRQGFEAEVQQEGQSYAGLPVAAIIAFPPLVESAVELRDRYWPDAALIYMAAAEAHRGGKPPRASIALEIRGSPQTAVEMAFQLFPDTRHVVIAGGATQPDRDWVRTISAVVRTLQPDVEVIEMPALPLQELQSQVAAIPPASIVLLTPFTLDTNGAQVSGPELVDRLGDAAHAPMFDLGDLSVGEGVVGAFNVDPSMIGEEVGKVVRRLVQGEPAQNTSTIRLEPRMMLDGRQLQRFGVPDTRIPESAGVAHREPTRWASYRGVIALVVVAVLAQALLILLLLAERRTRRESQRRLSERLRYEQLVSEISTGFANLPQERLQTQIDASMQRMAEFLDVELVTLWRYHAESDFFERVNSWNPFPTDTASPAQIHSSPFTGLLKTGQALRVTNRDAFPEGSPQRVLLESGNVRSSLDIPLFSGGQLVGTLIFATMTHTREWPESLVQSLQTLAELFANALARDESEGAARAGENLNAAVLASLPGYVAIVDREGVVLRVNDHWKRQEPGEQAPDFLRKGPGSRYQDPDAIAELLGAVLSGERARATAEVQHPGPRERWFEVRIEALQRPQGGAVISFVDITATKRAEAHDARNRETILHMGRLAAVTELAASIAHELRQPLGAIAMNAASFQMQLRKAGVDDPDTLEPVADIASDAARAGETISRMRALLRKRDRAPAPTLLNDVIRKAARLVARDALLRQITMRTELCQSEPVVTTDTVQLQQVLINLASNAMDAMAGNPPERSLLVVRSRVAGHEAVFEVEDAGRGIPPEDVERIFEPFHTTKPNGLGVGLSVSRAILESDGGRLWAENLPGGGAIFRGALPLTSL
jgi:signal transduction histidine kinase